MKGSAGRRLSVRLGRLGLSLVSILLAAALWSYLSLPYRNPHHVIGILSQREFNPATNIARFVVFVSLPSLVWTLLRPSLKAFDAPSPVQTSEREDLSVWPFSVLTAICGLGLVVALLSGLHTLLSHLSEFYLDLYEDGAFLAATFNWVTRGGLWTGNYHTRGALYDVFSAWLGWRLLGQRTIGAFKVLEHILDSAVPLALWLVVICAQYSLRGVATRRERAVLVALTLSLLSWAQIGQYVWFQPRSLPMLLSLSALILGFGAQHRGWFFASGALGMFALFTSSDSGIYCLSATVLTIGVFAVGPRFREHSRFEILPWVAGVASGHLAVLLLFGGSEYLAWMSQILSAATRWDFVYSYIYPSPLSRAAWRTHTWPMVLLTVILLGFSVMLPRYRSNLRPRTQGQIHLLMVAISLIAYRTGLGRSDPPHISVGLAYSCFSAAFTLWLLCRWAPVRLQWGALALASVPLLLAIVSLRADGGWGQAANVWTGVRAYAETPDSRFMTEQERNVQPELAKIFKDQKCLFVFPNEPGWYYLLQKPTCGRFLMTVDAMGDDYQAEVVRTLSREAPRYLLYSSPVPGEIDGIPNSTRLPILDAWLNAAYAPFSNVGGWVVFRVK